MYRYIKANTSRNLESIAHNVFNDVMKDVYYQDAIDHNIDKEIARSIYKYYPLGRDIDEGTLQDITELVYDNIDSYYDEDHYFGSFERKKFGQTILDRYNGSLITKRRDKVDANIETPYDITCYGLGTVADDINTGVYNILRALEGMCYGDESTKPMAYEVSDGYYYVGKYTDYKSGDGKQALHYILDTEQ